MDMILKTTALCKSFKGQMAVNNVSLNIQRNSIYGLLWAEWCGEIYHLENDYGYSPSHLWRD